MDAGQASVQDLLNAAEGLRPIFSCTAVGVAVFLYDYILSLHYEVEHIWKAKWNSVKFFFLLSRYLPFLEFSLLATYVLMDGSDPERCKIRYQSIAWLHCLGLAVTEILLTVRTWAVWEKSTRVGIFLIAFYIACWGPIVALSYFYLHSVEFLVLPRPFDRHCINSGKSMFLTAMWVIILVYDTVILGLMLVRGISALRLSNFHHFPVQKAVYNYGLIYYIYLFILTVVNLACMVSLPVCDEHSTPIPNYAVTLISSPTIIPVHLHQSLVSYRTVNILNLHLSSYPSHPGTAQTLAFVSIGGAVLTRYVADSRSHVERYKGVGLDTY